jgi:hypothetical protein
MRSAFGAFAVLSFLGFGADSVNFDSVTPGTPPPNWTFTETHSNHRARWEVRNDPSAPSRGNVLVQSSGSAGPFDFPMAIFDRDICSDGDLSVKFRIDPNRSSRTAGLVWRYQDPNNYYLLHFSVEARNIALFRMQNGKATPVPVAGVTPATFIVPHEIRPGQWYVAKVIFRGTKFRILFGNRRLFEAEDAGILAPGKTGVWTKGRTTASFDDFRIDKKN